MSVEGLFNYISIIADMHIEPRSKIEEIFLKNDTINIESLDKLSREYEYSSFDPTLFEMSYTKEGFSILLDIYNYSEDEILTLQDTIEVCINNVQGVIKELSIVYVIPQPKLINSVTQSINSAETSNCTITVRDIDKETATSLIRKLIDVGRLSMDGIEIN